MTELNGKSFKYLGKPRKLVEGADKVTGHARYVGDLVLPGMLYAHVILSPYAHAAIKEIDKDEAEKMPGVVAVLTAADLPTKDKVISSRNSAILAKEKVLWRGQPVVTVVAETAAQAQDAADMVFVDYDPLPALSDLEKAMQPGAPILWPNGLPSPDVDLSAAHTNVDEAEAKEKEVLPPNVFEKNKRGWGDIAQGKAESDLIVTESYKTAVVHQGYLEPHAVVAEPDPLGRSITIYASTQGQFLVRGEVATLLNLPESKVRVVPMTFGGGFGAKYGIIDPLAAAVAMAVKRPVKITLSRSDDFAATTPANAIIIKLTTGAKKDGTLTFIESEIYLDNGVFAFTLGGIATALLGGYYKCPHVQITTYEVNTNKAPTGAYRAPSAPQITFALESNIDDMARALQLDPLQIRMKNAATTGDKMGNGNSWPEIGLDKVLQQFSEHPAWQNREKGENEGIGIAIGGWPAFMGPSAAICRVDTDGMVSVQSGAVDISGVNSTFVLVAAEVLGVDPAQVEIVQGDTQSGPFAPNSGGSQITYSVSGAIAAAAGAARRKLLDIAAEEFEASAEDIEIVDGEAQVKGVPDRKIDIGSLVKIGRSRRGGIGPIIGEGNNAVPENAPGFVVHLVKVAVDPDTGTVTPTQYLAVQDVGFAMNPLLVDGQMQGGAIQGLGMGLYEAMVHDDSGQLLSGSFMDYAMPRTDNVPDVETVLVEHPSPHGPFGARGIGEPPITAGAAAIANAIKDATGVRVTSLPIKPETLWQAMQT